jgi:uncharacterized protein (DUF4415 family)
MVLTSAVALAAPLGAQQHPATPQRPQAAGAMMPAMASHMHTMDSLSARLDTAVARMNRATGEARTTAMQDVLRELVAAQKAMHTHMSEMASHHQMGDSAGMRAPMQHQHPTPGAARPDSASRPRR